MWAKGYKLFAIWGNRPAPEAYRIDSMNTSEDEVAAELASEDRGGGDMRGDDEFDTNSVYDAAGTAGYQILAPREDPDAGLGHHDQSPYRLRCIDLMRTNFGHDLYHLRGGIERTFANLTSFGGGLAPLPAWVRHENRVRMWVSAKILINAERIMRNKRLAA
ncbi:Transposase DDE domain-containing protein [Singulisphaera sp. GP187]|nr:Transposase DDE domain-containing protein [Singulisphaera sp. GP187]